MRANTFFDAWNDTKRVASFAEHSASSFFIYAQHNTEWHRTAKWWSRKDDRSIGRSGLPEVLRAKCISAKASVSKGAKRLVRVLAFAWLLRNAIAHGDRWNITDPNLPATTWNGVTISQSDNAASWFNISKYIGGGDVILLMEELNETRL